MKINNKPYVNIFLLSRVADKPMTYCVKHFLSIVFKK